ncbi:MAG: MGMT family protein [bacterium]|nr:MGMT family protein [bacterium]
MGEFEKKVYAACARISRGKVSTYAEIAKAIGSPKAYRAVGNALNKNRNKSVPCHRGVCSDGRIGGFAHGSRRKRTMLEKEGVMVIRGKVKDFETRFQTIRSLQ